MIKDIMTSQEQYSLWKNELGITEENHVNMTPLADKFSLIVTYWQILHTKPAQKVFKTVMVRSFPSDKQEGVVISLENNYTLARANWAHERMVPIFNNFFNATERTHFMFKVA